MKISIRAGSTTNLHRHLRTSHPCSWRRESSERHTAENLSDELLRVENEWQVANKVVSCVTDNAANITKAINHPCLAHTINLMIKDALKVVKPTMDKVKAIVKFFHKSQLPQKN